MDTYAKAKLAAGVECGLLNAMAEPGTEFRVKQRERCFVIEEFHTQVYVGVVYIGRDFLDTSIMGE